MAEHWMQRAFSANPGALHRALHVPERQKIPAGKLASAANSDNPTMRRRAALAKVGAKVSRRRYKASGE